MVMEAELEDSGEGRPTKLTDTVEEKILSAIRAGNYSVVAAKYAGITERTFYRWLRRGLKEPESRFGQFREAVLKAEQEAEVRAVAILQKHMDDNWQAAMAFLERKFPTRWGRKDRLRIDVDPRDALAELLGLTPDELDDAVEALAEEV